LIWSIGGAWKIKHSFPLHTVLNNEASPNPSNMDIICLPDSVLKNLASSTILCNNWYILFSLDFRMSLLNKSVSIGCAAVAVSLAPTFIALGVASSVCNSNGKSPLEKQWILFGTPILLGYASYALWFKE
jgi:hypothetical protein